MKFAMTPAAFRHRRAILLAIRAGCRTRTEIGKVANISPTHTGKYLKELCEIGSVVVYSDTTTRCRAYRLREQTNG